jgi:hypothetical protein
MEKENLKLPPPKDKDGKNIQFAERISTNNY